MKNKILLIAIVLLSAFTSKAEITSYAYNSNLILYPNPATSNAHIILPNLALRKISVFVVDFRGQIMKSWIFAPGGDQVDIDISSLPIGEYSIRVQEEGFPADNLRLVKQ